MDYIYLLLLMPYIAGCVLIHLHRSSVFSLFLFYSYCFCLYNSCCCLVTLAGPFAAELFSGIVARRPAIASGFACCCGVRPS